MNTAELDEYINDLVFLAYCCSVMKEAPTKENLREAKEVANNFIKFLNELEAR